MCEREIESLTHLVEIHLSKYRLASFMKGVGYYIKKKKNIYIYIYMENGNVAVRFFYPICVCFIASVAHDLGKEWPLDM